MCTSPLKGFPNGFTAKGKVNYIIASSDINHIELTKSGSIIKCKDRFVSDNAYKTIFENIDIPCGQCLECRLEYSRQWANRCMLEAQDHDANCFITLTYDDLHIPVADSINSETGEKTKVKTLVKKDWQLFMKRLRKVLDEEGCKIRFFACGEYGDTSLRPHYHAIIFGWRPSDLVALGSSSLGDQYYYSPFLETIWPYGNNLVADCTWESCAYVARYVVKKSDKFINNEFYKANNIAPEFVLMSRRPGIGKNWYEAHKKCYAIFSSNYLATDTGSRPLSHNRYFDTFFEKDFPDLYLERKEVNKKFSDERKKLINKQTSLSYNEYLQVVDRTRTERVKILKERTKI